MRPVLFPVAVALAAAFLLGCSSGDSGGSPPPPPASVPSGLSATAQSGTSIRLTWTGSSTFTGYRIYRNDVEVGTATTTEFTDTGLSPTTSYRYFVRGESSAGLSGASATVSAATLNMLNFSLSQLIDPASRSYLMVRDVEFDAAGNIFVAGGAFSANFPTTPGAYDRTFGSGGSSTGSVGPSDAFVMKFNRSGQLLWSTFVGGPNHDRAYGLEIAPDGGIVIAGRAGEGFPTTPGVVQPAFGGHSGPLGAYGKQDGFIAKLSADGSTLLWSTYFGDPSEGIIRDVGVDANNKIYIVGGFYAGVPHITANAVQSSVRGSYDLVYARLNATASAVEYATYLGGNEPAGSTAGTPSIAVAPDGNAFMAIEEGGSGAPVTPNAYRRTNAGGDDFLLAHFSPTDQLVYATYLGGAADEDLETHNIAIDSSGRLAIAGVSDSSNYPVTNFAYQQQYGGKSDGVVSILSADGASLAASTYLGGGDLEDVQGVEFSPDGLLYVSGGTRSTSLKATVNAFRQNSSGVMDAFLAALTTDLRGAPYLSYFGGTDEDISRALAVASDGAVAFAGHTKSPNLPVTGGGSTAPNGAYTGWWTLLTP